jgi:hypothetical protein
MKKQLLILSFSLINGFLILQAQDNKRILNQIQTQKIAFFTQKMGLTPDEAQKFWPVYNEYSQKKEALTIEKKKLLEQHDSNTGTITDAGYETALQKFVQINKLESVLFEEYNKKFREILPASKVFKLYLAENQFKDWLLRQIKMRDIKT